MAMYAGLSAYNTQKYSDMGLLGPILREHGNGNRMFDPRQIPQLYMIQSLREMGCSTKLLQEYGQARTPEWAYELFSKHAEGVAGDLAHLQAMLDMLQSYLALMEEGRAAVPGEVEVRMLAERPILLSAIESQKKKGLHLALKEIRRNGNPGCPLGYMYQDFYSFVERPDQPVQFVSYDPQGPDTRPAGEYLVGTATCYYGRKDGLASRMYEYTQRNRLEFYGPVYAVYLLDATSVTEPEKYLLQIAVGTQEKAEGV